MLEKVKRTKNSQFVLPFLGVLFAFTLFSCGGGFRSKSLSSDNPPVSIKVPWYWSENADLFGGAVLGASTTNSNAALFILLDPWEEGANIDALAVEKQSVFSQRFQSALLLEAQPIKIDGLQGWRFLVEADNGAIPIKYYQAVLQGEKSLIQIISWSGKAQFERNKEEILWSIETFREN